MKSPAVLQFHVSLLGLDFWFEALFNCVHRWKQTHRQAAQRHSMQKLLLAICLRAQAPSVWGHSLCDEAGLKNPMCHTVPLIKPSEFIAESGVPHMDWCK